MGIGTAGGCSSLDVVNSRLGCAAAGGGSSLHAVYGERVRVGTSPLADDGGMVIEELQFVVSPDERDQFLEVEGRVWTTFLKTCDGFVRKEVWTPRDDPGRVVAMIWWETMEQWQQVTPAQCDEVDARMGEWLRPVDVFRAYDVTREDH